jgi:hypothetical protein
VAWLQAAQFLAATRPQRGVIFVAYGGAELGGLGWLAYQKQSPNLTKAFGWLELGRNLGARGTRLIIQSDKPTWLRSAKERMSIEGTLLVDDQDMPKQLDPNPAQALPPTMILAAAPGGYFHHPEDRLPSAIDLGQVKAIARGTSRGLFDILQSEDPR